MELKDVMTLQEVAREYNIPFPTLQTRLKSENLALVEGIDYKKLGMRLPTLLSPSGIAKITKNI